MTTFQIAGLFLAAILATVLIVIVSVLAPYWIARALDAIVSACRTRKATIE